MNEFRETSVLDQRAAAASRFAALERGLATTDSVTAFLLDWCTRQGLSHGPIVARPAPLPPGGLAVEATPSRLDLREGEQAVCRHVFLSRGPLRLCEAVNWYVPNRLPVAINRALETTLVPFGQAIAPLGFARQNSMRALCTPIAASGLTASEAVVEGEALIIAVCGRPLAVVRERFLAALLD